MGVKLIQGLFSHPKKAGDSCGTNMWKCEWNPEGRGTFRGTGEITLLIKREPLFFWSIITLLIKREPCFSGQQLNFTAPLRVQTVPATTYIEI